ncbi:MAG: hypothetical protein HY901_12670, partial [Deltaproteobacteria bacterium]|nr:hypothetical protein [Deltaproteobacteria bacterium]
LAAEGIAYQRDVFLEVRYRQTNLGKRRVSFLLPALAVDVAAEKGCSLEALRRRAAALLLARPVGLALDFGGCRLQTSRAERPEQDCQGQ